VGALRLAEGAGELSETESAERRRPAGRSSAGAVGRRQVRAAGRVREHAHRVKVTAEQEARLVELAGARGITVARLLVESALSGGAESAIQRAAVVTELSVLGTALGRVGVNLNQIARVTNATGEVQPATEATLAAVREVAARLEAVLDALDTTGRREQTALPAMTSLTPTTSEASSSPAGAAG
jgi:hypothetical protein